MSTLTAEQIQARKEARVANEESLAPLMPQATEALCKKWGLKEMPEDLANLPSTKKLLKDIAKGIRDMDKPKRVRNAGSVMERAKAKLLEDFQFAIGSFQKKIGNVPSEELIDEQILLALAEPRVRTRAKKEAQE